MNFHVLTLFPEMVMNGLSTSIIGRAMNAGLLSIEAIDIRDFAENKHNRVDDYPYGGGA
ncbi:MAG: tRNA (guanosine(37)-N1)-methyltransferase TrmD, partial [Lachnospiraceae bacterium]|nr:tRNA (guanosine(37)-N1)-methyltransferase TrmD [Lachnospiraceae bacterium]